MDIVYYILNGDTISVIERLHNYKKFHSEIAATQGHINILKIIYSLDFPLSNNVPIIAAGANNKEILLWWHKINKKWGAQAFSVALRHNDISLFNWMAERQEVVLNSDILRALLISRRLLIFTMVKYQYPKYKICPKEEAKWIKIINKCDNATK